MCERFSQCRELLFPKKILSILEEKVQRAVIAKLKKIGQDNGWKCSISIYLMCFLTIYLLK